jgi:hypothetical protein
MDTKDQEQQNIHRYRRHPRGSSPASREQTEGFVRRGKALRSIEQYSENREEAPPATQGDSKKARKFREEEASPFPTKSLWRDEGGESG